MKQFLKYALICFCFLSCKKSIDIPPPINQLNSDAVFENDNSAIAALNGIYSKMMTTQEQIFNSALTLYTGLTSDELFYYSPNDIQELFHNQITELNHGIIERNLWSPAYQYIYGSNAAIEGLNKSKKITPSVKTTLLGEAKFLRAYTFFYLVNLFGDVPLTLTTSYSENSRLPRTPKEEIYDQIVADFKEAEVLLPASYQTTERIRPTKWAASAMLAKVYLYRKMYAQAEAKASTVIASPLFSLPTNLNDVFLGTSKEAIWQLKPVNPARNTYEGRIIIPATSSATPTYLLTSNFMNSFESGDKRKISWTKAHSISGVPYYYPFKYKVRGAAGVPITEYYTLIRLAEIYLIRAEASLQLNNLTAGKADLNTIRVRAGLSILNTNDKNTLIFATEEERRRELFAELGNRWFDLIRTDRANTILPLKGPNWQSTDQLFPIPQMQISLNPLLTQNPGY